MRKVLRTLLASAALVMGCAAAAAAADSLVGTWKLNVARSTFSPGPAFQSQTRTYAESPQGLVLTLTTTTADGKTGTSHLTFKYDGKPYPMIGNPDFDSVSVTRVDAYTTSSTQLKAGKSVGTGLRTVSKDGKTMTFEQQGTHVGGVKYHDKLSYDRQ
jgi:hypothetical protein